MVKLSYMSPAQAQAEKSRLDSSVENLRNLQAQKRLLISHDRIQQLTTLTSDRDNAKLALVQAKLEAEATEIQFRITKQTATNVYDKEQAKLEDIQRQRAECRIYAPDDIEDGSMVVYFKNDSNRFRSTTEGLIEQGAQVKEGQKMLRIPNLSKMQVNTKIHEAMVGRVKGDVRVPTRATELMQIGMVTNTSLLGRTLATREDIMEKVRDYLRHKDPQFEYKKVADGQHATIRVESILGKQFVGHVRSIAAVASQADFFSSDVKLFQTYVLIGGELEPDGKVHPLEGEHLKPDMTAEVTIHVEGTPTPVLTVPIQAVIGGAEMGGTREVFVKTPTGYDRRPVTLGLYNDRMVEVSTGLSEGDEVSTGLSEGDEVVVNPKVLLGDDKTKTRENGDSKGGKNRKGGEGAPGGQGGGDPGKGGWKGGKGKGKGGFGGPPPVS
ncbi:MAG TPA: hypothetical protein VLM40_07250 [Gemmata sp.]|nr:hypothetical protein [Gemmata sp.]